jgi:uncharacterized protein YgiM (DUF1202 family)
VAPSTTYTYQVAVRHSSGALSPRSNPESVTTEDLAQPPPTGPPTEPPQITVTSPAQEPDTPSGPVGSFQEGDLVATNSDVYMRTGPSLDAEIVVQLAEGTELTVTDESVAADDYVWVPVADADGNSGFVVEDFLSGNDVE